MTTENEEAKPVDQTEARPVSDEASSYSHPKPADSARARLIPFARIARQAKDRFDIPRLNISDDIERGTFVSVLLGISLLVWVGEYFGFVNSYLALLLATLGIAGYGLLCFTGREQRIRLDRAGDNCYYLGLTFTLISLSVALFKRQIGESPEALIQTFGIAVGSTIVGVIARLLLIQYRTEPDDIEARARVELAAAADALKRQLVDAAARFQTFAVSIQDSVRTSVASVTDEQIARQKELVTEINSVLTTAIQAIGQSTTVIESSLKQHAKVMEKYQSAADKSANAADTFASKIETLAVPDDLITRGFSNLKDGLDGAVSRLEVATKAFGMASSDVSAAASNFSHLAGQSAQVTTAIEGANGAIAKLHGSVEGMSSAISNQAGRLAEGNGALETEVAKLKKLSLDYAQGLTEVAQFLAKEVGRART